jgi:SAM-dependent methyltransferase
MNTLGPHESTGQVKRVIQHLLPPSRRSCSAGQLFAKAAGSMAMLRRFTKWIQVLPLAGPALCCLRDAQRIRQFSSANHWERRYRRGGNSGTGSYGKLAQFKAEWLNAFVREHEIQSVIEFGCGDGNQLSLTEYPRYLGLDVSRTALVWCIERFQFDPTKSFLLYDPTCFADAQGYLRAELALSLDVIYHLVEDHEFKLYMAHLFQSASRYVVVYASNHNERTQVAHVRHRKFTDWVEKHCSDWQFIDHVPNRYPFDPEDYENTSFANFFVFGRHD